MAQANAGREQSELHASLRWFRRRWTTELIFALLVFAAAVLVLSPVLRRSGWPLNAGSTAPLLLVQMYASHFRHLDFFPVWSSSDAFGMGSPGAALLPPTFFYVAGLLMAWGGLGLKAAVVTTIGLFLFVGAYGMRQALRVVTDSQLLCTVGSLGFLFTNYVFTDWLFPRGDLAEFSAVMLVPWLLYWCLVFVKDRRFSYLLIPIMVLLVNTHSAIALTALFALAVALVTFLWHAGSAGLRAVLPRMAISLVAITVLLAPLLIAEVRLGQYYDPQTKNTGLATRCPSSSPVSAPILSTAAIAGSAANSHDFVQIDYALWVPIALAVLAVSTYSARTRRSPAWWSRARRTQAPVLAFLVGSLVVYLFLQLRLSLFVYRIIPPLQVTNLPVANAGVHDAHRSSSRGGTRRQPSAGLPPPRRLGSGGRRLAGVPHRPLPSDLERGRELRLPRRPGHVPVDDALHRADRNGSPTLQRLLPRASTGGLYSIFFPKVLQADGEELPDDPVLYSRSTRTSPAPNR